MKGKAINTLMLLLLCALQLVAANEPLDRFEEANKLYESGDFEAAKSMYQGLLSEGYRSDDLHFNLGNTYYKRNQIAFAILHYEKSLKLNPNNEDARVNLKMANAKTVDKVESIPELFIYRWWKSIYNLLPADTWAKLSVAAVFLSLLLFCIYLFFQQMQLKKVGFYSSLIAFGLFLLFWFLSATQNSYLQRKEAAIIMAPTVNIISAPSEGSSQLFVLHEGTKVKILEENEMWMRVSLPNGKEGWLQKNGLAPI